LARQNAGAINGYLFSMIEPPQSAKQPTGRGKRLPDPDANWGLSVDARINRAAKLASDLQQILSFAAREYNQPTRPAVSDQSIGPTSGSRSDEPGSKAAATNSVETSCREADSPRESAPIAQPPAEATPPETQPPPTERDSDSIAAALEGIERGSTNRGSAQARKSHSLPALAVAAWRDGLLRKGPWLVSATLCALIAVDLARASMTLFFGGLPEAPLPAAAINTPRAPERPAVDVHSILAARLFGVPAADPAAQDPTGAPRPASHLLLAGTLATDNPTTGLAIISDSGPAQVYKVGASVGGASLQSVYRDRVILSRNGTSETLVLPKPPLGKGTPAAAAAAAPSMTESGRNAADVMRTSATLRPDGKLRGFRVYPNGNRVAFDKSGLRGGDLVVAVNGTSLEDQDRNTGQEMLNTLVASGTATLTIMRNGERRDITVFAPDDSSPNSSPPE